MEKIVERIEEMSKQEGQFDKREQMRLEVKRKQGKTEDSISSGGRTYASVPSLDLMKRFQRHKEHMSS